MTKENILDRTMRLSRLALPILALLAACTDPSSKTTAQTREVSGAPLPAPTRLPPPDAATMRLSFSPIVKRAAPAVVNVHSERRVRQQVDPFWEFFGGGGVPRERVEGSLGSGAIVREDGIVVTNNHVIEGGDQLRVVLSDRREFPAKVLLADPRSDLAVLKIDTKGEKLPVLPIAALDDVVVGHHDPILAHDGARAERPLYAFAWDPAAAEELPERIDLLAHPALGVDVDHRRRRPLDDG